MFLMILLIGGVVAFKLFNARYHLAGVMALIAAPVGAFMFPEKLHTLLPAWQYWTLEAVSWSIVLFLAYRYVLSPLGIWLKGVWLWIKGKQNFPWARSRRVANGSGGNTPYGASRSQYDISRARHSFKDVMGMEDLKKRLLDAHAAIKAEGKNGILLTGDPGNGKTFIAEALAGELGLPFMPITFGDVASKWVNQTTEQVVAAFDSAVAAAPCLMFLDELDSLLKDRNRASDGYAEQMQTTNAILTKLVDVRGSGVVIVAASNFPDMLDRAATREGRFDFKIEVPPPDYEARMGLLGAYLAKGLAYANGVRERIAKRWEGFSNVRIRTVVEFCSKEVKKQGRREVEFTDLAEALREVQGTAGVRLPEDTKPLDALSFPEREKAVLQGLAQRMIDIDEVERLGGTVPKGVLFFGPPGTGKTATAKGLAKSSGWAFLPTTGQELLGSPEKVDEILKKAADIRPCIVFIDEADDVLQDRAANPFSKASTNKLLAAMDGVTALPDIMFIAATNHPDVLDAAAVRGGRFSEKIEFRLPDDVTVQAFVAEWLHGKKDTPFGADFSVDLVAKRLSGVSLADAQERLQQAINHATPKLLKGGQVGLDDLEAVL